MIDHSCSQGPRIRSLEAKSSVSQWVVLSGHIVGQRLGYQDQLDAATTTEQVAAIVPVYTLP